MIYNSHKTSQNGCKNFKPLSEMQTKRRYFYHMWWTCKKARKYWERVEMLLLEVLEIPITVTPTSLPPETCPSLANKRLYSATRTEWCTLIKRDGCFVAVLPADHAATAANPTRDVDDETSTAPLGLAMMSQQHLRWDWWQQEQPTLHQPMRDQASDSYQFAALAIYCTIACLWQPYPFWAGVQRKFTCHHEPF